jgi:hypothetical protein
MTTKRLAIAIGLGLVGTIGCAGSVPKREVEMGQLHRKIGQLTGLDQVPLDKVEYLAPGKQNYDEFFRASAEMRSGVMFSEAFSQALTRNLKSFARSYVAERAADQNVAEIVGTTPTDQLTEDQAFAVLTLKKKRGELHNDEVVYVASSATNTGQMIVFLNRTQKEAQLLTEQGNLLAKSVQADFADPKQLPQAPAVAEGLKESLSHVQQASARAVALSKTLTRLGATLNSLR